MRTREGLDPLAIIARHQATAPVNLDAIAHGLGINVYHESLGPSVSGKITRDPVKGGPSGFAITINSTEHPNRRRFTLAHEIAHYVLHRDLIERGIVDSTMYRSELGDYFEIQANRMAAEILMPTALVRAKYDVQPRPSLATLARLFQVSEDAMRIKVRGLNLNQHELF